MSITQTYHDLQPDNLTRPVRYRHIHSHFVVSGLPQSISNNWTATKNIQEVDSNLVRGCNFPWVGIRHGHQAFQPGYVQTFIATVSYWGAYTTFPSLLSCQNIRRFTERLLPRHQVKYKITTQQNKRINGPIINYPRKHYNLLLLHWTTCFDQLIGHPQVLIYYEVSRELCARFGIPSAHSSLETS